MLSAEDLLNLTSDEEDEPPKAPEPVKARPASTPATTTSAASPSPVTGTSQRALESKRRMEELKAKQAEQDRKHAEQLESLRAITPQVVKSPTPEAATSPAPGSTARPPPPPKFTAADLLAMDSSSEEERKKKKAQEEEERKAAEAAKKKKKKKGSSDESTSGSERGRRRQRRRRKQSSGRRRELSRGSKETGSSESESTADSLEDWGVMVADRGTQTGTDVSTQTDPHPHIVACRHCYRNYFGREVEAAVPGTGCEHGVGSTSTPAVPSAANPFADTEFQKYVGAYQADREAHVPLSTISTAPLKLGTLRSGSDGVNTAQWRLQISKIHYMLDRTLAALAPDLGLAQSILAARRGSAAEDLLSEQRISQLQERVKEALAPSSPAPPPPTPAPLPANDAPVSSQPPPPPPQPAPQAPQPIPPSAPPPYSAPPPSAYPPVYPYSAWYPPPPPWYYGTPPPPPPPPFPFPDPIPT